MIRNMWYVAVNSQSYGPYTEEQMRAFAAEGRVTAHSYIRQNSMDKFISAGQHPAFQGWSKPIAHEVQNQAHTRPAAAVLRPVSAPQTGILARQLQPAAHTPQMLAPNPTPQPLTGPQKVANTVFIVMAEIRSANGMAFLQALQSHGTAQRIGDSVWLLKSGVSAGELRNALSQTLTRDDRLFLLDSFANETAWFNIGTDMDSRIRELWDMQA